MKHFIDGNQWAIVNDDFVDLQESPAVFIPKNSYVGGLIQTDGVLGMPLPEWKQCYFLLNSGKGGHLIGEF